MNSPSTAYGVVKRMADWLARPGSGYTLVIGATCGCDVTRLGRMVSDYLNDSGSPDEMRYLALGSDDIRQFASEPKIRRAILQAATRKGIDVEHVCDYECIVKAIAGMGGVVMSGEWASESSMGMGNVYHIELSHCDECRTDSTLRLDPESYSTHGLVRIIAKRFRNWIQGREHGRRIRIPLPPGLPMLI